MGDEGMFAGGKMKKAMEELKNSEAGRELADKIREKLKQLNDQYKELTGDEKKNFKKEFSKKFEGLVGDLTETLENAQAGSSEGSFTIRDDSVTSSAVFYNYLPFLLAVSFICLIFGFFGRKLYRSIKAKEQKKEKKPKKLPKTTQSPPASPQSKKTK